MKTPTEILGATAEVDIPALGIHGLLARVDTGAASCALHATEIHVEHTDRKKKLTFKLFDPENDRYDGRVFEFSEFSTRNVKNSFGNKKERPMIELDIIVDGLMRTVAVGLINRSNLTYDMLLGRNLIAQGFLVDVTK
jgi:hypothetical protein